MKLPRSYILTGLTIFRLDWNGEEESDIILRPLRVLRPSEAWEAGLDSI